MLKRYFLAIIIFSTIITGSIAATPNTPPNDACRTIDHNCFGLGERFLFDLGYSFINAGKTEMSIDSIVKVDGHQCYQLVSRVWSNKTFDLIYKVRDYVESNIDVNGIFSRRYVKRLNEGSYSDDKEVLYEQERNKAHLIEDGDYKNTFDIPDCAQDILSALYFVRTMEFSVGDTMAINLFDVDKAYPLKVKVNRREHVEVPAGEFDCLVVEPFLESEGMFRSEGRIELWLSDDENRIPVLMRTYIAIIGHIDAKLKEYSIGKPIAQKQ